MNYYHEQGYSVKSCTTDGFLVERSEMLPDTTDFGMFSKMFKTALNDLGVNKYFLEIKHKDTGMLT